MVDLTSVFQVRLKKKIRELIKEDADALYAFKSREFGGEAKLNSADYNNHLGDLSWLQKMAKSRLTVG